MSINLIMVLEEGNWMFDFSQDPQRQFDDLEILGDIKGWSARKNGLILLCLNSYLRAKVVSTYSLDKDGKPIHEETLFENLKLNLISLFKKGVRTYRCYDRFR